MNLMSGHLEFSYFFNLSRSYRRLGESDEMGLRVSWAPFCIEFIQLFLFFRKSGTLCQTKLVPSFFKEAGFSIMSGVFLQNFSITIKPTESPFR